MIPLQQKLLKTYLPVVLAFCVSQSSVAQKKPNILVIFGDDVGQTNISAYSFGVLGYKTPTSTSSPKKALCSPIIMQRTVAQPAVLLL